MEPSRRGKDEPTCRRLAGVCHEQGVSRSGRVVHEPGGIARPIELGHALKVWLRLSAESWHRPDADVSAAQASTLANPEGDQGAIRRESQRTHRWIREFRRAPTGQVVELSGTDLR